MLDCFVLFCFLIIYTNYTKIGGKGFLGSTDQSCMLLHYETGAGIRLARVNEQLPRQFPCRQYELARDRIYFQNVIWTQPPAFNTV